MHIKELPLNFTKPALLAAALVAVIGSAAFGQSLEEKRDKKLASEFLKKAAWTTDYDKALEEAKKTGKPIFGYFSRSYSP
jgi:hypothetical protein